jgi:hypothetical protein
MFDERPILKFVNDCSKVKQLKPDDMIPYVVLALYCASTVTLPTKHIPHAPSIQERFPDPITRNEFINFYLQYRAGITIATYVFDFVFDDEDAGVFFEFEYGQYLLECLAFNSSLTTFSLIVQSMMADKSKLKGKKNKHKRNKFNKKIKAVIDMAFGFETCMEPGPLKIEVGKDKGMSIYYKYIEHQYSIPDMDVVVKMIRKGKSYRFCDYCDKKLKNWKACPCKLAFYCGKECQRKDFKHHSQTTACAVVRDVKKMPKKAQEKFYDSQSWRKYIEAMLQDAVEE